MKDAGRIVRFVWCGSGRVGHLGEIVQKGPDHFAVSGQIIRQQEGVVAAGALDVAVAYALSAGQERRHESDLPAGPRRCSHRAGDAGVGTAPAAPTASAYGTESGRANTGPGGTSKNVWR